MKDVENGNVTCGAAGSNGAGLDIDNWVMADLLEQAQKNLVLRRVRGFLPSGSPVLNLDSDGSICHSSSVSSAAGLHGFADASTDCVET
jgi:hypothetical protein